MQFLIFLQVFYKCQMSILRRVGDIARGVSAELQADLQDVVWIIIDILGLRGVFEGLLREFEDDSSNSNLVRRRSIIRIIGSAIPLKPVQRPYLRCVFLVFLSSLYLVSGFKQLNTYFNSLN